MKMSKLVALLLAFAMIIMTLAACGSAPTFDDEPSAGGNDKPAVGNGGDEDDGGAVASGLSYASGTVLRMATGYNNADTGLSFSDKAGEGITLADGHTYHVGDLKPTWVEVQNILDIKIEDKYQGNSASNEYTYWDPQLDQVDIVSGTATLLPENGAAGKLVDLSQYLDKMPNFKAYLEKNPIVRLSITGSTTGSSKGAIYFSPYFDGVNDIERMPLMRVDWVEKLLNGDGEFTASSSNNTADPVYTPYMPTSGSVTVDVATLDGTAVETVTKNYDAAGNIVQLMNDAGSMSGVDAVNMLRKYIDEAYDGYYGTERANLFIGQNAAWDADELVALLRCVVANPQTLNGTDNVEGLFSREDNNNQRRVDMFRFAGHLFGVRGMESRQDYLYVGTDGELHDARGEVETYEALSRMNDMAKEGLISKAFIDTSEGETETYLENDLGFMHYDYNQTQTLYNATVLDADAGEKYMAVMVPVAKWYDGTDENGVYMRFTESWRSVKTDGWGISLAGVGSDENKLNAALALIDFAYSQRGQILMSYGPDAFIKTNADGSYVTFSFNGEEWPVIADETFNELWSLAGGNYTNYARFYLGSTLSFAKSQAFEYQCTHNVGKEGAGKISTAIGLGIIKHPELAITENPWYTSIPTVLPQSTTENDMINGYTELGSNGRFSSSKDGQNLFVDIIAGGFTGEGTTSPAECAATVSDTWNGKQYLELRNQAWDRLVEYYTSLNG